MKKTDILSNGSRRKNDWRTKKHLKEGGELVKEQIREEIMSM